MESQFLGVPEVSAWLFVGLAAASFLTNFVGIAIGAPGGLLMLGTLAMFFPPAVVIILHTLVQLGAVAGRVVLMHSFVVRETLPPFTLGSVIGAAVGAQIFITLPAGVLQGIIALFILFAVWCPSIGQLGATGGRFGLLGFAATFLGVFVSATGTLLAPFIASASPDRRNYVATFSALMGIVHTCKLVAFGALGIAMGAYLPLVAAMIATAFVANWAGRKVLDRVPERAFRILLKILLSLMALRLIWFAARSADLI
jgi:uncharacterized membrane protein YfcA